MANVDDVAMGLSQLLSGMLFPGVNYQQGAVANVVGPYTQAPGAATVTVPVRLYYGEPVTAKLDVDLGAGISNISIQRDTRFSRDTTRFKPYRRRASANVAGLQAALGAGQVTFGGVCGPSLICSVTVAKTCYAYLTTGADTVGSVVAGLAAAIPNASASGAVLNAAGVTAAAVYAYQQGQFVTGTQEDLFSVHILAAPIQGVVSGALARSVLSIVVDGLKSLPGANGYLTRFFGLPDGSKARLLWHDSITDDTVSRNNLWQRIEGYRIEYDTAMPFTAPVVAAPLVAGNMNGARIMWLGQGAPTPNVMTDGQGNVLGDAAGVPVGSF